LRRNISTFPEEIKKRAYQAIVRPNVEYASSAWDNKHILLIVRLFSNVGNFKSFSMLATNPAFYCTGA
jgi:hypothetical protein